MDMDPADLLRGARSRSGLSQRAMAERAGTAQSVVARIELAAASPTWDTLTKLLGAAGFGVAVALEPLPVIGDHMMDDVARILLLAPEQRLLELANASRFIVAAERV